MLDENVNDYIEVVKVLVGSGADINQVFDYSYWVGYTYTILHKMVFNDKAVCSLLQLGANPNISGFYGYVQTFNCKINLSDPTT